MVGLSREEAAERLKKYGYNEIKEKKISLFKIFLRQFKNFLVVILIFASVLSFFIAEITNALVILFTVLFVALLGFVQEYRAEKAMKALKRMLHPKCIVIRDGKRTSVPIREVVPDDLIVLESGDRVPADAKIIESFSLEANESLLTGESVPVKKQKNDTVFAGTTITKGHAKALVTKTGMKTELGKIAKEIQTIEGQMPLVSQLKELTKQLGIITIFICVTVFFLGLYQGEYVFDILIFAIAVAVAGIPESLPAVVTVTLALGMQNMARKKAIVRILPAVETLGCTQIICTDKTGTLTKGEMTVTKIYTDRFIDVSGIGYSPEGKFFAGKTEIDPEKDKHLTLLLRAVSSCNNSSIERTISGWKINGDPTEGALLVAALKANVRNGKRIAEFPFDDTRKCMSVVTEDGFVYTKGALSTILEKSKYIYKNGRKEILHEKHKKRILRANNRMCKQALRVIAAAYKKTKSVGTQEKIERNLIFLGLLGMIDPPREEVRDSLEMCAQAGIKVIMITGDNPLTAEAIGNKLGLKGKVLSGQELEAMEDKKLSDVIDDVAIFSRVSPYQKKRIVDILKKKGYTVAVTGDGVNDAPALKKADIGVAMGAGTDVAKEAADIILTDNNFSTIVSAVKEGRRIYDNIKKFVSYILSCNFAEVSIIFVAMLLGLPVPLLVLQILFINLITDEFPALGLSVEKGRNVMKRSPRKRTEKILSHGLFKYTLFISTIIFIGTLFVFLYYLPDVNKARTMAFVTLISFELFNAFNSRSLKTSVFDIGIFSNKKLVIAVLASLMATLLVIYTPLQSLFDVVPLNIVDWLLVAIISSTVFIAAEIRKKYLKKP